MDPIGEWTLAPALYASIRKLHKGAGPTSLTPIPLGPIPVTEVHFTHRTSVVTILRPSGVLADRDAREARD